MQKERLKRYIEKLELLEERLQDLEEWTAESDAEDFGEDKKLMLAVYKAMQETAECCMDLCAMKLKDSGKEVKDDYYNIDKLKELKVISRDSAEALKEANGLRNRLIHAYNGLEEKIAFESITELMPRIEEFSEEVRKWTKK